MTAIPRFMDSARFASDNAFVCFRISAANLLPAVDSG